MPHRNPELAHKIEDALDRWEEVKEEVEAKIKLGRLELDHMKLIDKVEENLVDITNKSPIYNMEVKQACDEAEYLRSRVRRKLLKEHTASEISFKDIVKSMQA